MKKTILTMVLFLLATIIKVKAQDQPKEYLGLPGDNLNLYAVMDLFQKSKTLEDFEKSLNDPDNRINNLDLNGDNLVDYITVTDYVDGNVHNIVLRVPFNREETQDVAVFTVQRLPNQSVQIQLIGDEALYGKNYIIEPIYDNSAGTPNPGYTGNDNNVTVVRTTTYEVAAWPLISFMYRPGYVVWHSSWYWGYYPTYWHPWKPSFWDYYYGYQQHLYPVYYRHYRHWEQPRYTRYNEFYVSGIRSHAPEVNVRIKAGNYKTTYSHPEQRREGQALYTKTHSTRPPTANSGTSHRTPVNKNVTTPVNHNNIQKTDMPRRTNSTVTEKKVIKTETSVNKPAGTPRKSTTTTVSSTKVKSNKSSGQKAAPVKSDKAKDPGKGKSPERREKQ